MRKRLLILLSVIFVLSMAMWAGCAKTNTKDMVPEVQVVQTANKLTGLSKDTYFDMMSNDDFGNVIVTIENKNEEDVLVSNTYKLYSFVNDAFIEGAEVTIPVIPEEPPVDALSYVTKSPIEMIFEGLYVTYEGTFVRETVEDDFPSYPETVKIAIFGKNGKAGEFEFDYVHAIGGSIFGEKDPINLDEMWIVDQATGARYYVDLNGNVVKEANPFKKILTYDMAHDDLKAQDLGDYILYGDVMLVCDLFDKTGAYVRSIDGVYELDIPTEIHSEDVETWYVDGRYFVQYSERLSDDAKEYDYIDVIDGVVDQTVKYDLVTKSYDLKSGKVRDIDLDFMVSFVEFGLPGRDFIVLYGCEIVNKKVNYCCIVQSFNKNGDVYVDLQKLVPGAWGFDIAGDYVRLLSGDYTETYINGKKIIATYSDLDEAEGYERFVAGNALICEIYDTVHIYDLEGNLKKTYTDVVSSGEGMAEATIFIELENSLVEYDVLKHEEKVIYQINLETEIVEDEGIYVMITNFGTDGLLGTDDDVRKVIFNVPGLEDITLAQGETINIIPIAMYGEETETKMEMVTVLVISRINAEGVETIDFYRVVSSVSIA